jgi:hypothetical protein
MWDEAKPKTNLIQTIDETVKKQKKPKGDKIQMPKWVKYYLGRNKSNMGGGSPESQ